jgi:hypothetical protein
LLHHNPYWRWMPWDYHCLSFCHNNSHSIALPISVTILTMPHATISFQLVIFFYHSGAAGQRGSMSLNSWGFQITHNDDILSVGLLWTSDQPDTDTTTWQHTTLAIDIHLSTRRNSILQSQTASGRRPTTQIARPLKSAVP